MKRINIDLKIGIQSLDLTAKDDVAGQYIGNYKSIFKGRGLEFDSYREYTPDDDASMIDWKASARTNSTMVKQYAEERNLDIFFLIDVSNSMILSSQPKLKCEYAAEVVASLSHVILRSGDNVGYAFFNDQVTEFVPPNRGTDVYSQLIESLSLADNYGGGYDLARALDFVLGTLRKGAMIIIVSDFIGLSKGWDEAVRGALGNFSLIGLLVRDPIDRKIPKGIGQLAIGDPMSEDRMLVQPNLIKPFYEREAREQEEQIRNVFLNNGADFVDLQTDTEFLGKLIDLFEMRKAK